MASHGEQEELPNWKWLAKEKKEMVKFEMLEEKALLNDNASTLITMGKIIYDHRCDNVVLQIDQTCFEQFQQPITTLNGLGTFYSFTGGEHDSSLNLWFLNVVWFGHLPYLYIMNKSIGHNDKDSWKTDDVVKTEKLPCVQCDKGTPFFQGNQFPWNKIEFLYQIID